jgi:mannose-6-phosphate isomerase-like protein (cupin superfamily)
MTMPVQVAQRSGVVVTEGLPVGQEFDGHHGPTPMYLTPATLPGTPISIAAVDAAKLIGAPHADLHLHDDHEEIYLCVTPGCRFTVELADDAIELTSPASVFIPAGVRHRLVVHEVETETCPFLGILLDPGTVAS